MSKEEYLIITSDKARKNPGAWKTFAADAEIEVVHAKNRLWTYQCCDEPDKEHLIYEGLKISVQAGKKLRINAPKDDSGIVIKFFAEKKESDSLSKLKGLNINIMYPSGNTTPLIRTTQIDTKIRLLRVNDR